MTDLEIARDRFPEYKNKKYAVSHEGKEILLFCVCGATMRTFANLPVSKENIEIENCRNCGKIINIERYAFHSGDVFNAYIGGTY